ncbi:hypothetical protein GCM10019814_12980 [Lactococcus raffinolactis]|jgi:hypothetical protein
MDGLGDMATLFLKISLDSLYTKIWQYFIKLKKLRYNRPITKQNEGESDA